MRKVGKWNSFPLLSFSRITWNLKLIRAFTSSSVYRPFRRSRWRRYNTQPLCWMLLSFDKRTTRRIELHTEYQTTTHQQTKSRASHLMLTSSPFQHLTWCHYPSIFPVHYRKQSSNPFLLVVAFMCRDWRLDFDFRTKAVFGILFTTRQQEDMTMMFSTLNPREQIFYSQHKNRGK